MKPDPYLTLFSVQNPRPLAQTPRAHLWRVDAPSGPAVLKVLTDRGAKTAEMNGAKALEIWGGEGAVRLIERSLDAMVLEWLPGQALKDKVPLDRDEDAAKIIADIAMKLRRPAVDGFITLQDHFGGAIAKIDTDQFPTSHRGAMGRAQAMWHSLVSTTHDLCLLHGDLNYENIIWSERGWLAIDPKDIIADPCYEFGIFFRNPVGEGTRIAEPKRIVDLAEMLSAHTDLDKTRILQFGFAHVAMSLAYHFARGSISDADAALLHGFDSLQLPLPH